MGGFSESQTQRFQLFPVLMVSPGSVPAPCISTDPRDAPCQGGCGQDCRAGRNTEQGELQRGWRSPKMREEDQCVGSMGMKTGSEGCCMCRPLYEAKEMRRAIWDPTYSSFVKSLQASSHWPSQSIPCIPKKTPTRKYGQPHSAACKGDNCKQQTLKI